MTRSIYAAVFVAGVLSGCVTWDKVASVLPANVPPAVAVSNAVDAVTTPNAATVTPVALLAKPATLVEPEKGIECMVPFGLDIRGLAWSPARGDWLFIGCDSWVASLTRDGKTIIARPSWTRNGITYVLKGWNAPRSVDPVTASTVATYRETTRFWYWPTKEAR